MFKHENRSEQIRMEIEPRNILYCIPHFHESLELVLMLEGTATARADARTYRLEAGDVYLSFPNQVHAFDDDSPNGHSIIAIVPLSMCSDYKRVLQQYLPMTNHIPAAKLSPQFGDLIMRMQNAGGIYADSIRKGLWLAALGELLPHMQLVRSSGNESDVLRSLLNYCKEHLNGDLSLSEVAERVCVGKYYISHLFRERLGIGFHEYVNMMRVNEAAKLLRETSLPVTEVGDRVGFPCQRTFNRVFQAQRGCSPREYRQNGGEIHDGDGL